MITLAFIDASNLFYGGEKSLGWKIDYQKLFTYLKEKYEISKALYDLKFNYLKNETVPIDELEKHLTEFIKERGDKLSEPMLLLLHRHLQRIRFYLNCKDLATSFI